MAKQSPLAGFMDFVKQYGVLPLAIGVVIGTAVNELVKNLVEGIISPLISLVSPATSLATWEITVRSSVFKPGLFIDGMINFLVIAFVVYGFVKIVLKEEAPKKM